MKFFARIFLLTAAVLTIVVFHANAATVTAGLTIYSPGLQNGLVGHWTFDGKNMVSNVTDSSGNNYNGVLSGFTSTTSVPGVIGQALLFDSTNDFVNIGTANLLTAGQPFTISWWENVQSTSGTYHSRFTSEISGHADDFAIFRSDHVSYQYMAFGKVNATNRFRSGGYSVASSVGVWRHWVIMGDNPTSATLGDFSVYADGVQQSLSSASTFGNINPDSRIGYDSANNGANVAMDDFRVYNRTLSASEVKRLYMLGAGMRFGTPAVVNAGSGQGLVGHWTFDGKKLISNAADSSGLGKNGALRSGVGSQTATTTSPGISGQALSFDGTDDWINITDTTDPTVYTISAWVKPADTTSVNIFMRASSAQATTAFWTHQLRLTSGSVAQHYLYDGAAQSVTGTTVFSAGQWYHVVGTAQNGGQMKLYVNGVEEGTPDTVGTMTAGGDRWYPGTNTGDSMGYFNGLMDDVRLYNRVLTPAEIKRLYVMGVGTRITPPAGPNTAPTVSDAGRIPTDGSNVGGGVQFYTLRMNPWTDPEGDSIEYYFEHWANNSGCTGASTNNSGWISDPTASGGLTVLLADGTNNSWKVKARDEHGLESGYNSCYFFSNSGGGSCPYVFGWNGEKFVFEVDIFGSGGLGYKKWGLDDFVQPAPNRTYVIGNDELLNDVFEWRIVGDLNEVDYFDYFRLYSVFLPEDRDIIVESPTLGSGLKAKSILHTVATEPLLPKSAVRLDTDEEVTEEVSARDDKKVILNRNKKETYEYEQIEVDFGDISQYPTKKLIIGGSTTYPVTEEGIARKQQFGLEWGLYVQDEAGEWKKVPNNLYSPTKPLSFDSVIAVDISKIFISKNTKIRLEYLYKVYIDYIALDVTEDLSVEAAEEHPIVYADLHDFAGWHEFNKDGHMPDYYDVTNLEEDYEDFPGYYTRFGDVIPLLEKRDDKFVVMAKADEVTVKNVAPKLPVPDGYKRVVMLDVTGFYKALGKTQTAMAVEPMPFSGMSSFPYPETEAYPDTPEYQAYLAEYNTRYLSPEKQRGNNPLLGGVKRLWVNLQGQ